jgi:hypothetical protein
VAPPSDERYPIHTGILLFSVRYSTRLCDTDWSGPGFCIGTNPGDGVGAICLLLLSDFFGAFIFHLVGAIGWVRKLGGGVSTVIAGLNRVEVCFLSSWVSAKFSDHNHVVIMRGIFVFRQIYISYVLSFLQHQADSTEP